MLSDKLRDFHLLFLSWFKTSWQIETTFQEGNISQNTSIQHRVKYYQQKYLLLHTISPSYCFVKGVLSLVQRC